MNGMDWRVALLEIVPDDPHRAADQVPLAERLRTTPDLAPSATMTFCEYAEYVKGAVVDADEVLAFELLRDAYKWLTVVPDMSKDEVIQACWEGKVRDRVLVRRLPIGERRAWP